MEDENVKLVFKWYETQPAVFYDLQLKNSFLIVFVY